MAVDCDGATTGVQSSCAYAGNAVVDIQVHVTQPPDMGYSGFQTKLRWDEPPTSYLTEDRASSEAIGDVCDVPTRYDNRQDPYHPDSSVLFACVSFPVEHVMATGPVLRFRFHCQAEGAAVLELVPHPGDDQHGSHFLDAAANEIDPTLSGATVACGPCPAAGCAPPAHPPTPTPSPNPTPTPSGSGGMAVDCDAASPGIQSACEHATGETFDVEVHVTYAPAIGYGGFDVSLGWTDAPLDYVPMADARAEALWPACDGVLREDYQAVNGQPRLLFTCLSQPVPQPRFTDTGAVLRFEFRCLADGEAVIDFTPPNEPGLRTKFIEMPVDSLGPELFGAALTCASPP
jgi:hypothetical protein